MRAVIEGTLIGVALRENVENQSHFAGGGGPNPENNGKPVQSGTYPSIGCLDKWRFEPQFLLKQHGEGTHNLSQTIHRPFLFAKRRVTHYGLYLGAGG